MGFTYAWSNDFIDSYFRSVAGSLYFDGQFIGLSTTTPSIDGTGVTEPAGGSYQRTNGTAGSAALNLLDNHFTTPAASRTLTSDVDINFQTATAGWGTVTHSVLYEVQTVGTLMAFGALTTPETVFNTDSVKFNAGDMSFSFGGEISDYLANLVLDQLIDGTELTEPTTIYFGLSTTAPNSDGTGVSEPVGGSYARVGVTTAAGDFDAAASGATANTNDITFPVATGSWGTLTHWVAYDALTVGNLLFYATLNASQAIISGDQVKFLPGDLTYTIT